MKDLRENEETIPYYLMNPLKRALGPVTAQIECSVPTKLPIRSPRKPNAIGISGGAKRRPPACRCWAEGPSRFSDIPRSLKASSFRRFVSLLVCSASIRSWSASACSRSAAAESEPACFSSLSPEADSDSTMVQIPRLQPRTVVVDLKSLLAKRRPEVIVRAVREGYMNTEGSKCDYIPESPG